MFGSNKFPKPAVMRPQAVPTGSAQQFPKPPEVSRLGEGSNPHAPEQARGFTRFEQRALDLLEHIAKSLSGEQPIFNPQRFTVAIGATVMFQNGVIPGAWYVSVENTTGALLELHAGEYAGTAWAVLGPSESARFPATAARIVFKNVGTAQFAFTVAAISRDASVEIRGF